MTHTTDLPATIDAIVRREPDRAGAKIVAMREVIETALRVGPIASCYRYGEYGEMADEILAAIGGAARQGGG